MVCVWVPNPHKEMDQNDYCGESHPAIPPPQTSKKPPDIPSKNILDSVSKMSLDITKLG